MELKNDERKCVPEERVTSSDRLVAIIAKNISGTALSQEDLDAMNPDHPTSGINRIRKNIADLYKVTS